MRRPRQSGFALLEVLVATVILATAIAGLMSALSGSLRVASRLTDYVPRGHARTAQDGKNQRSGGLPRLPSCKAFMTGAQTNGSPRMARDRDLLSKYRPILLPASPSSSGSSNCWWTSAAEERTFEVEGFRRFYLRRRT